MVFTQPLFFAFLAIVLAVHWALRGAKARKWCLVLASFVFYGAWDWRFLSLVWVTTVLDFAIALAIARGTPTARRRLLVASVVVNLGILGFFKYFGFFVDSAVELSGMLGFEMPRPAFEIILPVGISFYTFQTMSYTIDVYRERLEAVRDLLDFALFIAFFPQLVAGPIVRASQFLPQLRSDQPKRWRDIQLRGALILFLFGYIKKACVADNLAPWVDAVFGEPAKYAFDAYASAVLAYAVQIYCDFSGYTDMAIAVSALFGYNLIVNFAWPYFSTNISEFWQRWHISLSTWLRDYLYLSLPGIRSAVLRYRNVMITMLLGGLWHGASWHFVVWGGLHGIALVVHRRVAPMLPTSTTPAVAVVANLVGWAATMYWICITWFFFRAPDLATGWGMTKSWVTLTASGKEETPLWVWGMVGLATAVHWTTYRGWPQRWLLRANWVPVAIVYGLLCALSIIFIATDVQPFIYFQF